MLSSPLIEVVLAQAPVTGHINAEDEQTSLHFEWRIRRGLNPGTATPHVRDRLNLFENIFGKSSLAGSNLQLRLPRNLPTVLWNAIQHGLVRRVLPTNTATTQDDAAHVSRLRTACLRTYCQLINRSRIIYAGPQRCGRRVR
jgi:hypothetical protein